MSITLIHRHPCCSHHHAAAVHHGWLAGVMGIAMLVSAMYGVVRTVDGLVWGKAYSQHVISGSVTATADAETLAGYGTTKPTAQFRPVTDRIFGH